MDVLIRGLIAMVGVVAIGYVITHAIHRWALLAMILLLLINLANIFYASRGGRREERDEGHGTKGRA